VPAVAAAFTALALILGGGGAAVASAAVPQADPEAAPAAPGPPLSGRLIVQWEVGAEGAERAAARTGAGVRYGTELGDPGFQLVETRSGEGAGAAAQALEADPAVALAEPDGLRRVEAIPNDPLFAQEWGLQNTGQAVDGLPAGKSGNDIDVLPAWERTAGTPATVVADLDTGYRADSPDLGPVEWTNPGEIAGNGIDDDGDGKIDDVHGWDFVGENSQATTEDNDPTDSNLTSGGHGVHTAGIIGAKGDNGTGITGVAQDARIMPLRVCTNDPAINEARCPTSAIVAAINYAGARGARVANLSLGGTEYFQAEVNALAANPETLYVISAGNDTANDDSGGSGTSGHHYPCDYRPATESSPVVAGAIENTICVAALDPSEGLASYSDYGHTSVDLAAPGSAVLSTFPTTETLFSDNFEAENFGSQWTTYGAGFGRAGAGDGPLTSFGITDSPGAAPLANHTYGVEKTTAIAVPSGTGACRVEGSRYRKGGGSEGAPYGVIVDGSSHEYFGGETSGTAMVPFRTILITGLGGHAVQPFFEYRATGAPAAADGSWLDNVALTCNSPLSVPPAYAFRAARLRLPRRHLDGGAAGQRRGGAPVLARSGRHRRPGPRRAARVGDAGGGAGRQDRDRWAARRRRGDERAGAAGNSRRRRGTPPIRVTEGTKTVETLPPGTRAQTEEAIIKASPPATLEPKVSPRATVGCVVPKLVGKTLGQAKAALGAAGCKLGKLASPKTKRGSKPPKLVVKSASPAAGARAVNSTVAVTLAAKPKHHH
jgi:Subtilase family